MINAAEIDRALRARLAPTLHPSVPRLAQVLAEIANGSSSPRALEPRVAADPQLAPLVQALAGQTIALGNAALTFESAPGAARAAGLPGPVALQLKVVDATGREQAGDHAEERRIVAISGGAVFGPVVGENSGTITYTNVTVQLQTGTRLDPGAPPTIVRCALSQPPLPIRTFYDREQPLAALKLELLPRHGAWVSGALGCGLTALLKQAANLSISPAFADGVLYVDGAHDPAEAEDVIQQIYNRFYRTTNGDAIHMETAAAEAELGALNALFLLDRLRLSGDRLASLANTLSGRGTALVAAEGLAPDTLLDLPIDGLPPDDAMWLCAAEARIDAAQPQEQALLQRLCAALDRLPLPLLLAARLIRLKAAPLEQLVAVAEDLRSEREPLARAVRLTLTALSDQERTALAALTRVGGPDADMATLSAASQLPAEVVEDALARMMALRLVTAGNDRFMLASESLRRVLARLLPRGDERRNAALFLAGSAAAHMGGMGWLGREWINLMAAARTLQLEGQPVAAGQIARALQPHMVLSGQWGGWQRVIALAEQAAQSSGDAALRAWALHERGTRAGLLGDLVGAKADLTEARRLRMAQGDHAGAEATLHNMEYLGLLPPPPPTPPTKTRGRRFRLPLPILVIALLLLAGGGIAAATSLFSGPPPAPIARMTAQPTDGSYPLTVAFDASESRAGQRGALAYLWDFGDGATLATSASRTTHRYAAPGVYHAALRVRDSNNTLSAQFSVTLNVINTPPQPTIELSAPAPHFAAGQQFTLRGSAIDHEDGRLPGQALHWNIVLRQADHTTTLAQQGGATVRFSAPAPTALEEMPNAVIEVGLSATDSQGRTGVISQVLQPDLARVTLASDPPGLQLGVNGRTVNTPIELEVWKGYTLNVAAAAQQDASGRSLIFARWSDDAPAAHAISAGSDATYTATFVPLTVGLDKTSITAGEGDGAAAITVSLNGQADRPITVAYVIEGGSATAGRDYKVPGRTLTFAPGETQQIIRVPIVDDKLDEADETINLTLSNPANAALGDAATAVATILDDDDPPTATFLPSASDTPENAKRIAVTVRLSAPSEKTVTIGYTTRDGSAVDKLDYGGASDKLIFEPGETSKTFFVTIIDDTVAESQESFTVAFSVADNAATGPDTQINIIDDDPIIIG